MNPTEINRKNKIKQKAANSKTIIRTINNLPVMDLFPQLATREFLDYGHAFDTVAELMGSRMISVKTRKISKG